LRQTGVGIVEVDHRTLLWTLSSLWRGNVKAA
jgi:hypothetical protein